jgi:hypothetical protein
MMYRKLKRLDAYQAEYRRIFDQTNDALNAASIAMQTFKIEGREVLEALDTKIGEARAVLSELETARKNERRH